MAKDFMAALVECVEFLECKRQLSPVDLAADLAALAAVVPGAAAPFAPPWCGGVPPDHTRSVLDAAAFVAGHEGRTKPAWTTGGGAPEWVGRFCREVGDELLARLAGQPELVVLPAPKVEAPSSVTLGIPYGLKELPPLPEPEQPPSKAGEDSFERFSKAGASRAKKQQP